MNFNYCIACACVLFVLQGCTGLFDETDCTDIAIPGIKVRILDPDLVIESAVVKVEEQDFVDEFRFSIGDGQVPFAMSLYEIGLAVERSGIYNITVESPGFNRWERRAVEVVDEDRCHVRPVEVDVVLQPDIG